MAFHHSIWKCQGKKTLGRHKYIVQAGVGESKPHKELSVLFLFMHSAPSQHIIFPHLEGRPFLGFIVCVIPKLIRVLEPSCKAFSIVVCFLGGHSL